MKANQKSKNPRYCSECSKALGTDTNKIQRSAFGRRLKIHRTCGAAQRKRAKVHA